MEVHKNISIPFRATHPVTGELRRFEGVGFLEGREEHVQCGEIHERTKDENGGMIKGEDSNFLVASVDSLPPELDAYCLVSGARHRRSDVIYECSQRGRVTWQVLSHSAVYYFTRRFLVVRRLP